MFTRQLPPHASEVPEHFILHAELGALSAKGVDEAHCASERHSEPSRKIRGQAQGRRRGMEGWFIPSTETDGYETDGHEGCDGKQGTHVALAAVLEACPVEALGLARVEAGYNAIATTDVGGENP